MTIDQYVIHLHQQAVDNLQRRPVVLAKAATVLYAAAAAIRVMETEDGVLLGLSLLCAATMAATNRSESWFASVGSVYWIRVFMLAMLAADTVFNLFKDDINFAGYLMTLSLVSYYYFAACKPPKPPKRKEKTFLNPALKGNV